MRMRIRMRNWIQRKKLEVEAGRDEYTIIYPAAKIIGMLNEDSSL